MTSPLERYMARVELFADTLRRFATADGWQLLDLVDQVRDRPCRNVSVEVFFPSLGNAAPTPRVVQEREKVAGICGGCPVADECLAGAVLRGEKYGAWGGVAEPDYRRLAPSWRGITLEEVA